MSVIDIMYEAQISIIYLISDILVALCVGEVDTKLNESK